MKLYTEEQMKDAILESFLSTYPTNGNDILSKYKPIELPSDEEIDNQIAEELSGFEESECDYEYSGGFEYGAKWVIEQIKQQDIGH